MKYKCRKCGKTVAEEMIFCPFCGLGHDMWEMIEKYDLVTADISGKMKKLKEEFIEITKKMVWLLDNEL